MLPVGEMPKPHQVMIVPGALQTAENAMTPAFTLQPTESKHSGSMQTWPGGGRGPGMRETCAGVNRELCVRDAIIRVGGKCQHITIHTETRLAARCSVMLLQLTRDGSRWPGNMAEISVVCPACHETDLL